MISFSRPSNSHFDITNDAKLNIRNLKIVFYFMQISEPLRKNESSSSDDLESDLLGAPTSKKFSAPSTGYPCPGYR